MHDSHGSSSDQSIFPPAEWESLQAEDRAGAKAISGLLIGIFSMGLILYSIVAWTL